MRTAVLLDETAEGVDLRSNRDAGDVIARQREGRFQRPDAGLRIEHLMEILIDFMFRIAGDRVNFTLAFDDGVLAGRDRHARLLDPFAWICSLGRNAGHVTLLLDRLGDVGDGLVVQTEKEREFCSAMIKPQFA